MASKLDRLLDMIHPSKTIQECEKRADDAINGFAPKCAHTESWDQFCSCLIRFLRHTTATLLRLKQEVSVGPGFDWGRCCQILTWAYGATGYMAAFEIARTGNEGGLYAVLKTFAYALAEEYANGEIETIVNLYWNSLSVGERLSACDEYLDKYGQLLPSEMTENCAARVRANLPRVLEEHPHLIQHLNLIGRA